MTESILRKPSTPKVILWDEYEEFPAHYTVLLDCDAKIGERVKGYMGTGGKCVAEFPTEGIDEEDECLLRIVQLLEKMSDSDAFWDALGSYMTVAFNLGLEFHQKKKKRRKT